MRGLNSKHRRTLAQIRRTPTPTTINWVDVKSLLAALGCQITPGKGSRFRIRHRGGRKLGVHRPHPGNECSAGLIESVREFLEAIDDEA